MKIGVIADDFTGASDIALTLAEAGMSVNQFIGVPDGPADTDLGAGVIALKTRTAPVDAAVAQSLAACDWLLKQGAQQFVFKVCSTFDCAADGNIGPVLDALANRLDVERSIVCPAFPENGRSVYQGHLFVNDVLLNQSGMEDHPLTPMTDADLRRILRNQSGFDVLHVAATTVMRGGDAIKAALPKRGHVIVDAIRDADLLAIGQAAVDDKLLCGGSGIALGLPSHFGCASGAPRWDAISGPGVVLSGSCSRATRAQVDCYKAIAPHREVTAEDVIENRVEAAEVAQWALAQKIQPMIYSSADPDVVRAAQERFGRAAVAGRIEAFFADLARILSVNGVRRIVVAGGETSGAVVGGLDAKVLKIGPRLAAGVPVMTIQGPAPIALALKSGNFGDQSFFADALSFMGGVA